MAQTILMFAMASFCIISNPDITLNNSMHWFIFVLFEPILAPINLSNALCLPISSRKNNNSPFEENKAQA